MRCDRLIKCLGFRRGVVGIGADNFCGDVVLGGGLVETGYRSLPVRKAQIVRDQIIGLLVGMALASCDQA
jgi:hypothetical protein